ncbi:MAG: stage V sporulation protein AC [Clostridiales bacterium]|jgi:stage V sporulation protein AC|nr:stage V sporulation protein AC [Clostridiales bacterium]
MQRQNFDNKAYKEYVHNIMPRTNHLKTLIMAFVVGGIICIIGQIIHDVIRALFPYLERDAVNSYVTLIMIFLGSFLTAIGVYDDIGKFAGAGSIVPITGFANSVTSPAIEYKSEGVIYGIESKMFVVAGPIIVTGIVCSVIVGIIYLIIGG